MDCKKISEIYLESCKYDLDRRYKYINKSLQLKKEIVYAMNDKNCLEAGIIFHNYCDKEMKKYEEMKEYYDKNK